MDSGDYDSELMALSLMCAALEGTRFKPTGDDSSKADGFIMLSDGAEIEVEVTMDVSEHFMESVREAAKWESPIGLSPGSGSWQVLFESRTRVKGLHEKAQELVDDVIATRRLRSPEFPAAFDFSYDGLHIGIIQRMGDTPDELSFRFHEISNPGSPYINTSPDAIGHYAQEYIAGAGSSRSSLHRDSKFGHLASRAKLNGRQAHFAVVAISPKNSGVRLALSKLKIGAIWDYEVPREDLAMPEGVQGFWVVSPDFRATVAFIEGRGWFRFPA
jgi:uncharacterized protein YggL (DUF469 family)